MNCGPLITLEEVDEALGVTGQNAGIFQFAGGEVCTEVLADNEAFFVQIGPGNPGDLEPGAVLIGVSGESVTGVGDEAIWFGGEEAEGGGDVGVLSVRQVTLLGDLHYRIRVGRPDLASAAQLEIAKTLALSALPRFEGVELEKPEPELVSFEPEPVDLSDGSYVDNLLVKEEAGEWTRGEGLLATLRLFAGEVDQSDVLRHAELTDYSGTGVIALAREYLETGSDEEAKTEIARLLDQMFLSRQQLEEMAAEGSASSGASALLVSLTNVFAQEDEDFCNEYYGTGSPCLLPVGSPELEATWPGKYIVWRPVAEVAGGWTLGRIDATVEAMRASVVAYSKLTEMPPIDIVLTLEADVGLTTNVDYKDGACGVLVHPFMQEYDEDFYQQFLARDIAYCLIRKAFGTLSGWWVDGLATYLSGYVFPEVNLEHEDLPMRLEDHELTTTLTQRRFTNWVFFEHLHPSLGPEGNLSIIFGLPGTMGTYAEFWHHFNEELTDSSVPDIGPGDVPYPNPPFEDVKISGPMEMTPTPEPFGIARGQMTVQSGKKACVTYESKGTAETTWRSGVPGTTGGSWSGDLPPELTDVSVFIVTATEPGAQLTMKVEKVVPDDKECEEEDAGPPPDDCEIDICLPSEFYWPLKSG